MAETRSPFTAVTLLTVPESRIWGKSLRSVVILNIMDFLN